ncbi:hypothetical protein O9G_000089 [Rozella allomycis CSF55]|uniref:Doublecortin domain-containing protein n=1 Tax=Rozella allomycis (strain CSF55) TaxID=988480 RepID=A0A075ANU0_ROZAC|nr:hypothetical protein O9G_000089 [Rozella allomycis CSF55]|eukprot:EPZ31610.1 hypothetical protein O9G_000089 [Rozella allomycis CSF55]
MKGIRAIVFFNGDFMYEVSRALPHVGISIRNVFNAATYQPVLKFQDLFDGINLIATGSEPVQPKEYQLWTKDSIDKGHQLFFNPYQEKPVIIKVYPNGDPYHMGFHVSVTMLRYPTMDKLFQFLNNHITWSRTSAGKRLYELPSGKRIKLIDELVNGTEYVLGNETEPYIDIEYNSKRLISFTKISSMSIKANYRESRNFVPINSLIPSGKVKPVIVKFALGEQERSRQTKNTMKVINPSESQTIIARGASLSSIKSASSQLPTKKSAKKSDMKSSERKQWQPRPFSSSKLSHSKSNNAMTSAINYGKSKSMDLDNQDSDKVKDKLIDLDGNTILKEIKDSITLKKSQNDLLKASAELTNSIHNLNLEIKKGEVAEADALPLNEGVQEGSNND